MPLGVPELLIVLVIVLLILGPKRLPRIGRQVGGGVREFKDAITKKFDRDDEDEDGSASPPALTAGSQQPVATPENGREDETAVPPSGGAAG